MRRGAGNLAVPVEGWERAALALGIHKTHFGKDDGWGPLGGGREHQGGLAVGGGLKRRLAPCLERVEEELHAQPDGGMEQDLL